MIFKPVTIMPFKMSPGDEVKYVMNRKKLLRTERQFD